MPSAFRGAPASMSAAICSTGICTLAAAESNFGRLFDGQPVRVQRCALCGHPCLPIRQCSATDATRSRTVASWGHRSPPRFAGSCRRHAGPTGAPGADPKKHAKSRQNAAFPGLSFRETHGSCVTREANDATNDTTNHAQRKDLTMNANEIAFGIEFETTLPASDTTPIGPYHGGYQVPWLPEGWRAERDSSIRPLTPDRKGCEFVSPKLRGYEGLQQIEDSDRRDQRPRGTSQPDLRAARHDRMERRRRRPGPIDFPGRQPRTGHLRQHGNPPPRADDLHQADQAVRGQGQRQAALRSRPLPPAEPHAPGPRTQPHRVPRLRGNAQQDQGARLPDDVPGIGGTGLEHQALLGLGIHQTRRDQELLGSPRRRRRRDGTQPTCSTGWAGPKAGTRERSATRCSGNSPAKPPSPTGRRSRRSCSSWPASTTPPAASRPTRASGQRPAVANLGGVFWCLYAAIYRTTDYVVQRARPVPC